MSRRGMIHVTGDEILKPKGHKTDKTNKLVTVLLALCYLNTVDIFRLKWVIYALHTAKL